MSDEVILNRGGQSLFWEGGCHGKGRFFVHSNFGEGRVRGWGVGGRRSEEMDSLSDEQGYTYI